MGGVILSSVIIDKARRRAVLRTIRVQTTPVNSLKRTSRLPPESLCLQSPVVVPLAPRPAS